MPAKINDGLTNRERWRLRHPEYRPPKPQYTPEQAEQHRQATRVWSDSPAGIAWRKTRYDERRQWIDSIKLVSGCVDCGYREDSRALDFDHIKGEKTFNVSQMFGYSKNRLLAEIAKCEVVCANCHRIRTFDRGQHLR